MQSDQVSIFISGVFQQVMHELGIKQYMASAYHPESQDASGRFHQTLKNIIKSYCFDAEKRLGWRRTFAFICCKGICTGVSLGFSPFELVRGPLKLLKDKLLSSQRMAAL